MPEARAPERPLAAAPLVRMTPSTKVGAEEGAPTATAAPSQDVAMLAPRTTAKQLTARPVAAGAEPGRMRAESLVMARLPGDLARPQTSRVQPKAKVLPAALTIADPRDAARLSAVRPTDPTATPLTATAIKVAVTSPRSAATGSQLAVPTATATDRSLAVAITVTPQAPVKALLVAIDLRSAEDGPSVRLPEVSVLTQTSERGPTSTLDRPDPLEPMPISAVREDRRDKAAVNGDAPPAEHADESLVNQLLADARSPRRSDAVAERALPKAMLLPLAGSLGPGALAAPRSLFQRSFEQRKRQINEMGG